MKKHFSLIVLLFSFTALMASNGFQVEYSQPRNGSHQLHFTLGDYAVTEILLQGNVYSKIDFERQIVTEKKGFAELPYLNATVMLDPVKNVTLEVIPGDYVEIALNHPLVPSRGVIYRDQDPATVPYEIDPKSITDKWYPHALATNTEPFILRDIRGTSVYVYPFRYNAARQVLRVYTSLTVRLAENGSTPVNPLAKVSDRVLREMDGIYRSVFINYGSASRDDLEIGETGDILVVTTARDEAAIQPYVDWKREKGYNVFVEVVPVNTVVNPIVQSAYDDNNDILYVLLVGDWADIKCTTNSYGRPMDPQVGCVVGTDDFADIAVGRFSANSPNDVTIQVNKAIHYEKYPEAGGIWYQSAAGVASHEGAGYGDDGESDWEHNDVIWDNKLEPFTYETYYPVYDPGATKAMVNNAVNTGVSVINYTGHGWGQGWGTTGFSNTDVAALTNGDMLPFIISVACNNGDFDLGTCFGEAWLRQPDGGAIMFLGGSISQPWAPPMRGQDYFMDILIGGYDYSLYPDQNGITTTGQRTTLGSIVFNGLTLMCTESGGSSDWETAQTWIFFGDPSLQARTAPPAEISLSNSIIMVGIPFTTIVTDTAGPVPNAMVAISQDDLYFRGITDETGSVTIEHALNPGTARLVATAFNKTTIYDAVNVVPPDGPYITIAGVEINDTDGNDNGQLDYGETVYLTIGLTNLGSDDASGVSAVISCGNEFITILDSTASYGNIPSGDTTWVTDGYQIHADEAIPDMLTILFNLEATGSSRETWSSHFHLLSHAPVLELSAYQIIDTTGNNNGKLDPGETVIIEIETINTGSSEAFDVSGLLSSTSPYITITGGPMPYGDLPAGDSEWQSYEITVDAEAPSGEVAAFALQITAEMNITGYGEFFEYIGQIPVLLVDWDGNHNSPDAMAQCFENLAVSYDRVMELPEDLGLYASIFVCLGTYPDNYVLTDPEGLLLANYLENGGNLYMEGADTWFYDQQWNSPTPVHPMFYISGLADGTSDLSLLQGQPGSITEEMIYPFSGENSYIDHIEPIPPAMMMFMNSEPVYGTAVSHEAENYRTIGMSFEFGGLTDDDHNKDDLMIRLLDFFGLQGVWTSVKERTPENRLNASVYPNPVRHEPVIRFANESESRVSIDLYTINGQQVAAIFDGRLPQGNHEIRWNSSGDGHKLSPGMYFIRISNIHEVTTLKLIVTE
jgi:hypothetical protein